MTTRVQSPVMILMLACTPGALAGGSSVQPSDMTQSQRASLLEQASQAASINDKLAWITADGNFSLRISMHTQIRYNANFRDGPPDGDEFTHGIHLRRNKLTFSGTVANADTSYKFTFAASRSTGAVIIETATLAHKFADGWTITAGQAKPPLLHERTVSSKYQLAVDRSRVSSVFGQNFAQGITLVHTGDRVRLFASITDGIKTLNKDFTDPAEADIALTARAELRLGDAGFKQFKDLTGFPGDPTGVLLGIAGHWQTGGQTGITTTDTDFTILTADASAEGDGWNAHATIVWRRIDAAGSPTFNDYGLLIQGGVFVADDTEVFARWSTIIPDDDRAGGSDTFSTITAGANHYIVPGSHAVTISGDVQLMLDDQASSASIIGASTSINQLADTATGQVAARLQIEIIF